MYFKMKDLEFYIKESNKALRALEQELGRSINNLDFQIELAKKLGYNEENSTKILSHRLKSDEMIKLLNDLEFETPHVLLKVSFTGTILPSSIRVCLDEKQIKVNNEIWQIHKTDKDNRPSNPHAHNVETGYKLHLGNGQLYNSKCKPLNKRVKRKHLRSIRDKLEGYTLPELKV